MSTLDAFGVDRPDLIAKANDVDSAEGKRQRKVAGAAGLLPFGGAVAGAHYAPKGYKAGAAGRAFGRGSLEGFGGSTAARLVGIGAAAASRGKIKRPDLLVNGLGLGGGLAGTTHGVSQSVKTTQRRHGVQQRSKD